jgi:hypothetical protein
VGNGVGPITRPMASYRIFFGNDFLRAVQAAQGVLAGYPHWRYFQSRLLGPCAVKYVSLLFGFNYALAHVIVATAVLTLASIAMFHAGRFVGGRQSGWSSLLAFQILFALTMSRPWLYIWDYFILLQTAVFLLLVIRRAPWWAFLLLMSGAFLNHESAVFIGVWMVAQALADSWAERRHPDWGMLGGGVLGSLGGLLLLEYLRTTLLKREIGWEIFRDVDINQNGPLNSYVHVQISTNLNDILQWITEPDIFLNFLIPLTLIVALALAIILAVRQGVRAVGLATCVVAQIAALLAFGLRAETRNLLQLVPFLCLAGMLAAYPDWGKRKQELVEEWDKPGV